MCLLSMGMQRVVTKKTLRHLTVSPARAHLQLGWEEEMWLGKEKEHKD